MRFDQYTPDAIAQRQKAITDLKAMGLSNRDIARQLGCSIWTVRYWTNPQTRQTRIAYKAQARAG